MPGYLNHTLNNKAPWATLFRMFGDKIFHWKNLGWSREILDIFKATWYFQICKGLWYMKKWKRRKWAHLRDWLIKEYACLSLALIQLSLHQQISSTYTDNCWRYSCGTLLHASRRGLSVLNSKCMLFAHGKPFLLDQAPMSPFWSLPWCPQAKLAHIPACPTHFPHTRDYSIQIKCSLESGERATESVKESGRTSLVVQDKNLPANASNTGSIPVPWRSHMMWATKPVCHSYWAQTLEPVLHDKEKLLRWDN